MLLSYGILYEKYLIILMPKAANTVWQNEKFTLTEKNSSNQLLSNFFSKIVTFTKFLRKSVRVNFHNFHTVPQSSVEIKYVHEFPLTHFLAKIS